MKLSDAASIAEIVSSVAVVVSLIYVGIQLHEANVNAEADARERASTSYSDWRAMIFRTPESANIWNKGIKTTEKMSEEEKFEFRFMVSDFMHMQRLAYLRAVDLGTDVQVTRIRNSLQGHGILDSDRFPTIWPDIRIVMEPEFVEFFEGVMCEHRGVEFCVR